MLDHSTLPTVAASQMVRYEAMVNAIAECHRVDEVKDIRDKAMALEAYARQAKNTEAERRAADVRIRAEIRTGELLKELARSEGGRPTKNASNDATSYKEPSEYAATLESVGLSRQAANRYQQLANVPKEQIERHLADPVRKPTTNGILRESRQEQQKPIDPQALRIWGICRDMERHDDLNASPSRVFNEMTETMQADIRRLVPAVMRFMRELNEVVNV